MHPHPTPNTPTTLDAFTAPAVWDADPQIAFDTWIKSRGYKASTIGVKRAMWAKLSRWMVGQGKTLHSLSKADIERFLEDSTLQKEQRYRYVRLLDTIFLSSTTTQLTSIESPPPQTNPARLLLNNKTWHTRNDPTYILPPDHRALLRSHLIKTCIDVLRTVKTRQDVWPNHHNDHFSPQQLILWQGAWGTLDVNCVDKDDWMKMRNLALVAMSFGAGVKSGELVRMDVNCVSGDWVHVPATGRTLRHSVELLPFARPVLTAWLAIHRQPDAPLFPAWRLQADAPENTPLHPAASYRAIREVMAAAKLPGAPTNEEGHAAGRWGPQTLRNAFAAEHFDANGDLPLVMAYLTTAMALASDTAGTDAVRLLHQAWKRSRER